MRDGRVMGADPLRDDRSFSLANVSQEITPQMLDNIRRYWNILVVIDQSIALGYAESFA
jgi:hypothetical protein